MSTRPQPQQRRINRPREVYMQAHPLEPFFHQAVRNSYEGKLGLHDPDVTGYVAHLLCEFSDADKLYSVRDEAGRPIEELSAMMLAADLLRPNRLQAVLSSPPTRSTSPSAKVSTWPSV